MDAKPSGQRQTPNSFLAYAFSAEQPRKRKRSAGDDGEVVLAEDVDERPKPRRVNPHHLAARLGPDLVREMEVHIRPGAYMPSFAIRKDLQERYSVDRRHLYDYFHSRGLRVAKEERFNNLARSRQKKAQENAVNGSQSTTAKSAPPPRKRQTILKRQPFSQISTNVTEKYSSPAIKIKEESPDGRIPDKQFPPSLPQRINTGSPLTGPGLATISTLFAGKEPKKESKQEFSTPQNLSALQSTLVADSFSPSDMTINPRDIFMPAGTMPDPHLLPPYNVIEDPESPYLSSFADLDGLLPLTYTYESSLILPPTAGICPEKEEPNLYDLVHQSAMPLSAGTCGSYDEYMANRRTSYYDGLLTGYEDCRASSPSHALHDAFNDFDGWLVDDHPISQVVSSASTAPSISPSPRIASIIPPGKPTPCFQFLHPTSLAVSQTTLQRPRVPPSRIRRCSMSNFVMNRMRTVSAGGCF